MADIFAAHGDSGRWHLGSFEHGLKMYCGRLIPKAEIARFIAGTEKDLTLVLAKVDCSSCKKTQEWKLANVRAKKAAQDRK